MPPLVLLVLGLALFSTAATDARFAWSDVPARMWVTDGSIFAVAATPTDVYLGGDFTLIGRRTGSWARVDAAGAVAPIPHVVAGSVSDAVPDGAGGWFIAGDIESVGGIEHRRVAHLRADGRLDRRWHPAFNGSVQTLARVGRTLYLGGSFTEIDGQSRLRLASSTSARAL